MTVMIGIAAAVLLFNAVLAAIWLPPWVACWRHCKRTLARLVTR